LPNPQGSRISVGGTTRKRPEIRLLSSHTSIRKAAEKLVAGFPLVDSFEQSQLRGWARNSTSIAESIAD
jgi:hypothetical protein